MIQSVQGTVMYFFQLVHPRDQDLSFVLLKYNFQQLKRILPELMLMSYCDFYGVEVVKFIAEPQFDCFLQVKKCLIYMKINTTALIL